MQFALWAIPVGVAFVAAAVSRRFRLRTAFCTASSVALVFIISGQTGCLKTVTYVDLLSCDIRENALFFRCVLSTKYEPFGPGMTLDSLVRRERAEWRYGGETFFPGLCRRHGDYDSLIHAIQSFNNDAAKYKIGNIESTRSNLVVVLRQQGPSKAIQYLDATTMAWLNAASNADAH